MHNINRNGIDINAPKNTLSPPNIYSSVRMIIVAIIDVTNVISISNNKNFNFILFYIKF